MNSASAVSPDASVASRVKLAAGIEGPELAFVVELAPTPPLATGWLHQRAFADEADARILVADELARQGPA